MRAVRLVVVALLGVMVVGCGADQPVLTEPGTRFDVDPGDTFVVVLESNVTTGFGWELEVEPPEEVLRLVDDVYVESDTDLVGAAGRQELTFDAVGDGSTFIQLWYVRPFDDPPEPADRAQFEVIVGTGDGGGRVDPDDIDEPDATIPDDEDAISVSELLATSPSGPVAVTGLLFDDGSGLRLCGALAESFPPQCPGEAVFIANPEMIELVFSEEAGVRWTDRPVVLFGECADGEFALVAR